MLLDELAKRILEILFTIITIFDGTSTLPKSNLQLVSFQIKTDQVRVSPKPQSSSTYKPQWSNWIKDPEVSWYGPGFYCEDPKIAGCLRTGRIWHNGTACGQFYTKTILGVAHRSLPCGTLVEFRYKGIIQRVPVIDRGPYIRDRIWDLSGGLCKALRHCFTGPIEWRLVQ